MKLSKIVFCLFILFVLCNLSYAGDMTGHISLLYGFKNLKSSDWKPVEKQNGLGLRMDFGKKDWPVLIALDYISSSDKAEVLGINIKGESSEIQLGCRKYFSQESPSFYVGGGLAKINAEMSVLGVGFDDDAIGFWLNGGFLNNFSKQIHGGIDLRYSKAKVTIAGIDAEAGGLLYGLFLGFNW